MKTNKTFKITKKLRVKQIINKNDKYKLFSTYDNNYRVAYDIRQHKYNVYKYDNKLDKWMLFWSNVKLCNEQSQRY